MDNGIGAIGTTCRAAARQSSDQQTSGLSVLTLWVFAITCGISVANVYYAQPLLDTIATTFVITPAAIGIVVTLTQIGYAIGLLCLVSLGDLVDRRKLVVGQMLISVVALLIAGCAPAPEIFLGAMVVVGLMAVVVQTLVAFTATLAVPSSRGRAVGFVTSGVVTGILAARFVSGMLADLSGWRVVYLTSAAVMLLLSMVLLRILPRHVPASTSESYLAVLKSIPALFLRQPLLRSRAILALFVFASFSTLWTAMVLPLSAAPLSLSHMEIGLFGFAGLAGALAASGAGRLADRGLGQWTTGGALVLLTLSWLPTSLLPHSLAMLIIGVLLLDFAVQAVHVTNQSLIFAAYPGGHSRLVGGYMIFYSLGSAIGAIGSTSIYAAFGWTGVCVLGAAFSTGALVILAMTRRSVHLGCLNEAPAVERSGPGA